MADDGHKLFLSYHSPDEPLALRLKEAVKQKDATADVFFAPTELRAGGLWSKQLAKAITNATAFVLLVGERGVGDWQVFEYDEALDRSVKSPDFPLIVVLLEGQTAPGLPFLRRFHWIVSADPTSTKDIGRLFDALTGNRSASIELWRYTSPYRGLEAMQEKDSDYFFGRRDKTVETLSALAATPRQLPILIGNSGVGKSSLAQAGVIASLKRQAWPEDANTPGSWPAALQNSRQWCFLTFKPGTEPLKALVLAFFETWQMSAVDSERIKKQNEFVRLLRDKEASLADLLEASIGRRRELDQPIPPAFLIYIDQGEELYARADEIERRRFSEVIAAALTDSRLFVMMSMRSDFLGYLQKDEPLFKSRLHIDVPPLREKELSEVVSKPASLLGARFEPSGLADIIVRSAIEDSRKDAAALPLLSYTLDDMWAQMVKEGDGTLRISLESFELGGVLAERADRFIATHPANEAALRRILTLRLAAVRDDGEPTRRRAERSEFSDQEWRLVNELADSPYRLLVTVTTETGETYAEVAHETIFKRWDKLRQWIAVEREFLAWRTGLDSAARVWQRARNGEGKDALLYGRGLKRATSELAKRKADFSDLSRQFIARSKSTQQSRRILTGSLVLAAVLLFAGVVNYYMDALYPYSREFAKYVHKKWSAEPFRKARFVPAVYSADAEKRLIPSTQFQECTDDLDQSICPKMTVVREGQFWMGTASDDPEQDPDGREQPRHQVNIGYRFAVSTFKISFAEWDTCVTYDGCEFVKNFADWGRGKQPVVFVTWQQAEQYVAWLSEMTGRSYRLLSEAEYEYVARSGREENRYPWGKDFVMNKADCKDCEGRPPGGPAPLTKDRPVNEFGLSDITGNVWEWVADCYHKGYRISDGEQKFEAPTDGSAWTDHCQPANAQAHVVRGGSWFHDHTKVRSAARDITADNGENAYLGFRVARSITSK
jgi:formylglycine-generating enzyme required for sulfatase activity